MEQSKLSPGKDLLTVLGADSLENGVTVLLEVLTFSKNITGIHEHQESIELWLFNFLRKIYKINPNPFTDNVIQSLKLLVASKEERLPVLHPGHLPIAGLYIFGEIGKFLLCEQGGTLGCKSEQSYFIFAKSTVDQQLNFHREFMKQIISIYDCVNINAIPEEAAQTLVDMIDHRCKQRQHANEQRLRANYDRIRREKGLLPGQLRVAMSKRTRVTHCYGCGLHLETGVFLECSICNWLVCTCGACGCGYSAGTADVAIERDTTSDLNYQEDGDVESWTEISESFARSNDEGWYYGYSENGNDPPKDY